MQNTISRSISTIPFRSLLAGFTALTIVALSSPAIALPVDLNAGLIHHYTFEQFKPGTVNVIEDQAGTHDAFDTNGTLQPGKFGNSLKLNGVDQQGLLHPIPTNLAMVLYQREQTAIINRPRKTRNLFMSMMRDVKPKSSSKFK